MNELHKGCSTCAHGQDTSERCGKACIPPGWANWEPDDLVLVAATNLAKFLNREGTVESEYVKDGWAAFPDQPLRDLQMALEEAIGGRYSYVDEPKGINIGLCTDCDNERFLVGYNIKQPCQGTERICCLSQRGKTHGGGGVDERASDFR